MRLYVHISNNRNVLNVLIAGLLPHLLTVWLKYTEHCNPIYIMIHESTHAAHRLRT